jgi:hypothetical protein
MEKTTKSFFWQAVGIAVTLGVVYVTFRVASSGWNAGKK